MNIVVCIKQVPDTTDVKINKETNTLIRKGVESIINPYDLHAVEEGLRLREKFGGKVYVLSMGPEQVKKSLREAISLGVDEVILLSDRAFAGADTLATSYTLSRAISKIDDIDLILCGKQAVDGDTAQVGPELAEHLQIPHITYVEEILEINERLITVKKDIENGYEEIEAEMPVLITVSKEINEVRLPFIRGILRARDMDIPVWSADNMDLDFAAVGLDGSPTQVVSVETPQITAEGEIFVGEPEEQVKKLLNELTEQKII